MAGCSASAFQIADDVLDLVGNEKDRQVARFGPRKAELTLPLIRLLATAGEPDLSEIRQLLLHPDENTRLRLAKYFEGSDALQYAHRRALQLSEEARQQLDILPASKARRILAEIAEFAVKRTF